MKGPSLAACHGHAPPLRSVCLMGMVRFPYICVLHLLFLFKTEPRSGFRHRTAKVFGFGSGVFLN